MIFRQATVRLTLLFTVVLLLMFGGFAIGVYLYVVNSFDYDTAASAGSGAVDAAEQSFADLRLALTIGYLALVVIVPVLSYGMVKFVLRPVRRGYEDQQRFVDDASHEFRTPLAIIQGELELAVSRPRDEDEYREAIGTALEEVDHLTALTSDLLVLARGRSMELASSFAPVNLTAALRRATGMAADGGTSAVSARIRLHTLSRDHLVLGSEDLLVRAFANIVDNALKFSPAGAPVEVVPREHGDQVRIEVTDSGAGVAVGDQQRVFDRFWRAPASRGLPGHGLGLALVKQIVEAHHGSVRFESRAGADTGTGTGTTVTVELPLLRK